MKIKKNSFAAWVKAARPQTLGAISCPIFLGSFLALSQGKFSLFWFFVTWLCALLLQILANIVNDYGDFMRGGDTKQRIGPPRALQMGWLSVRAMKIGIAIAILAIGSLGIMLTIRGGQMVFWLGLFSVVTSIWYTAGPKPLAYLGFSEIAVLIFFGPVPLIGSYYIQTLSWPSEGTVLSIAPALLSTALIMTNNLRDISEDRKHHKKTLAVRFGVRSSRFAIVTLVLLAGCTPLLLMMMHDFRWPVLLSLLALYFPVRLFPMVLKQPIGAQFNQMLAGIAKSLYVYGAVLSLGLIYGSP